MLESILKGLLYKWGWSGAKRKTAQKFADDPVSYTHLRAHET